MPSFLTSIMSLWELTNHRHVLVHGDLICCGFGLPACKFAFVSFIHTHNLRMIACGCMSCDSLQDSSRIQ